MQKLNVVPQPNSVTYLGGCNKNRTLVKNIIDDEKLGEEGYRLKITADEIILCAQTQAGLFRGEKTLEQLTVQGSLPCVEIEDAPRFSYRGFLVDSVRHMQSVDEVKRIIDAAAFFKFNKFHWHLSDDQGFRIESEKYPLLNSKGSWREGDNFASLKSKERYGGYYTKAQIKEIVAYCADRFIDVIPEIDMPGHTTAIIHAYPHLSCRKLQIPVQTKQGIFEDILCAGDERTLQFVFELLEEIIPLFPSKSFHIGGDEAPKTRWAACPKCRAKMRELKLKNGEELQGWFSARIIEFLESHGKNAVVWNESLAGGNLPESATVQRWMDSKGHSVIRANRGCYIINSDFYRYYCDYPYHMTPLKKTYNYSPVPKGVAPVMEKFVLGVEAPLWTEYINNFDKLCYMFFPRFAAVAERGWTEERLCKAAEFEQRFLAVKPMLEVLGITPAPQSAWNPTPLNRLTGTLGFFKDKIDLKSLSHSAQTQNN